MCGKAKNKEEKTETSSLYSVKAETYLNNGKNKYALYNFEGAASDYKNSVNLNPNASLSYTNKAHVKYKLKDFDESSPDFKKANELNSELKNSNKD